LWQIESVDIERDLAVVLRAVPFEERHLIVTAITENHGRLCALARNSIQSRRFGGTLELFAASEWLFSQKPGAEMCRLNEAQIKRGFEGIRKDFQKFALGSAFSELMLKLAPERESCTDLFKLHTNAIAALEEQEPFFPKHALCFLNSYLSKILQWNGTQPQTAYCSLCKNTPKDFQEKRNIWFCQVERASLLCEACASVSAEQMRPVPNVFVLSNCAITSLNSFLSSPIRKSIDEAKDDLSDQKRLFGFIEALLAYHVPGFDKDPLKALRFLDLESNLRPN